MRYWIILLGFFLLYSCSSIHYMDIQTLVPAQISYPDSVKKLLIVNNAVPQSSKMGYDYNLNRIRQDTARIYTDSALMVAARSLGETIAGSPYYDDIRLYEVPYNTGGEFLKDSKLKQEEVQKLCSLNGTDAIISIDHLYFKVTRYGNAFRRFSYDFNEEMQIIFSGIVRSYTPESEKPLSTFHMSDSIYWYDFDGYILYAADYMGTGAARYFYPNWINENRLYFKSSGSSWKQASAYASAQRWGDALAEWLRIYDKTSSWKKQAKLATNIALGYELTDQLKEAGEWLQKAVDLYQKNEKEKSNEKQYLDYYKKQLDKKIEGSSKLEYQLKNLYIRDE